MQLAIIYYKVALKNTKGTTCGKVGPSVAVIVCHTWSGGTIYGNKIAVYGPGDQLWWWTTCSVTVHKYTGTVVQWYTGTVVHWYTGIVVHWYTGTLVHWYSSTLVQ